MIPYRNPHAMHALAVQWRKSKIGARNNRDHLEAFLEGALAMASAFDLQWPAPADVIETLDDLNRRGVPAISDFLSLALEQSDQ